MPITKRPFRALIAVFGAIIAAVTFAGPASAAPYTTQPTISVSRQAPTAGSSIFVCGLDFHARTKVTITLDGHRLASTRTNRSGDFCTSVKLQRRVTGTHSIMAMDRKGASASVTIQIMKRPDDGDHHDGHDGDGHHGRDVDHEGHGDLRSQALEASASSGLSLLAVNDGVSLFADIRF